VGLANAIYGSVLMVSLATFIGTPIGIMAASIWRNTASMAGWPL
jgi:ABC-type phosphate transport system permease subunit